MGGVLGSEPEAAEHANVALEVGVMLVSTAIALLGIFVAYRLYGARYVKSAAEDPLRKLGGLYVALERKLYFDEIYGATVVRLALALSKAFAWFDAHVIDGIVNAVGKITVIFSTISRWIDVHIVDAIVNFAGWITGKAGGILRYLQTGQVQNYMILVVIGVILMALVYLYG